MEHTENKKQESMDNNQVARKVSAVSSAINLILSVLKLIAGIVAHSGAMVSDALHSASDVGSTLIVIVGVRLAGKQSDQDHPYGHERMECFLLIILSGLLLATGIGIGISGLENIVKSTSGKAIEIPGMLALIAAVVSIVVKEWMFWYTRGAAKKINSGALMADAWHHRSDAFSSIGTALGIAGAIFLGKDWRVLDPIAAVIVSIFIVKVSIQLLIPCLNDLLERSLPEETEKEIITIINEDPQIKDPHNLRTRRIGNDFAIEVHIRLRPDMTVQEAHVVATGIENRLRAKYGLRTHVAVHVEPEKNE